MTTNLICLPYAGASKYSYNSFNALLPNRINKISLELPGRGERLNEPLLENIDDMAEDIFKQLKNYINQPYIIFGHSMGAILGYLVVKKIIRYNLREPIFLLLTGCEGPAVIDRSVIRSTLSREAFVEELKTLGGIPQEALNDESFVDFFEPILRSDFKALENYRYVKNSPFNIPISVLYGKDEDIDPTQASTWKEESISDVEVIQFPGDHFFIFKYQDRLIKTIIEKISAI